MKLSSILSPNLSPHSPVPAGPPRSPNPVCRWISSPNPPNVSRETLAAARPAASGTATTVVMDQPVLQTRDGFALRFSGQIKVDKPGQVHILPELR
ncbi:MAG UNVERIFIED_CONTAM: hypothetical protein LVR18_36800 [Planctomycetaceae bacterium]